MTTPRALGKQQRAQLIALHRETAGHIRTAFGVARARAQHPIHRLVDAYAAELARVREDEDDESARVPATWLHTHGNLRGVVAAIAEAVRVAAAQSRQFTQLAQYRAAHDGQANGVALIAALGRDEQARPQRAAIPANLVGYSSYDGRPLTAYFDPLDDLASDLVTTAATTAVVAGNTPSLMESLMLAAAFNQPLQRALVTGQQEATGAYRDLITLSFSANSDLVTGWIWRTNPGCCPFCASMEGTTHGNDEDLESHPNCQCFQEPIPADGLTQADYSSGKVFIFNG